MLRQKSRPNPKQVPRPQPKPGRPFEIMQALRPEALRLEHLTKDLNAIPPARDKGLNTTLHDPFRHRRPRNERMAGL